MPRRKRSSLLKARETKLATVKEEENPPPLKPSIVMSTKAKNTESEVVVKRALKPSTIAMVKGNQADVAASAAHSLLCAAMPGTSETTEKAEESLFGDSSKSLILGDASKLGNEIQKPNIPKLVEVTDPSPDLKKVFEEQMKAMRLSFEKQMTSELAKQKLEFKRTLEVEKRNAEERTIKELATQLSDDSATDLEMNGPPSMDKPKESNPLLGVPGTLPLNAMAVNEVLAKDCEKIEAMARLEAAAKDLEKIEAMARLEAAKRDEDSGNAGEVLTGMDLIRQGTESCIVEAKDLYPELDRDGYNSRALFEGFQTKGMYLGKHSIRKMQDCTKLWFFMVLSASFIREKGKVIKMTHNCESLDAARRIVSSLRNDKQYSIQGKFLGAGNPKFASRDPFRVSVWAISSGAFETMLNGLGEKKRSRSYAVNTPPKGKRRKGGNCGSPI